MKPVQASSDSLSRTLSFLSAVGLHRIELDTRTLEAGGRTWANVSASLPVGSNPQDDFNALRDRVAEAIKPSGEKLIRESGPKEAFFYADGSMLVVHGDVRVQVGVTPVAASAAGQVVPLHTEQATLRKRIRQRAVGTALQA